MRCLRVVALVAALAACNHSTAANNSADTATNQSVVESQLDLLKAGDPAICADRDIQNQIVNKFIDGFPGSTDPDIEKFRSRGGTFPPFANMSMSARNASINEVTCSGAMDTMPVTYKLRPGATGGVIFEYQMENGVYFVAYRQVQDWLHAHGVTTDLDNKRHADQANQAKADANAAAAAGSNEVNESAPVKADTSGNNSI